MVKLQSVFLLFSCCLLSSGMARGFVSDEVVDLPGLHASINFKHFSGYLSASGTKQLHYWFVESSNNPSEDPVILWLNGGPGCSSMEGLLNENGPFRVNPDSSISLNKFSWNKVASVIYLEAPAGVGYSYSADKNYTTDDDMVSKDNYLALKSFFKKFPKFGKNEFYITGESYGGIYVPTLSVVVSKDNEINFKGFATGNGLASSNMNDNSILYFAYYHGLIGKDTWMAMVSECCEGKEKMCNFINSRGHQKCGQMVDSSVRTIYQQGLNEYNLYSDCYQSPVGLLSHIRKGNTVIHSDFGYTFRGYSAVEEHRQKLERLRKHNKLKVVPPCSNVTALESYLNAKVVRLALHIPNDLPHFEICSDEVGSKYKRIYTDMFDQYRRILTNTSYRILVYNGDVDMACNFLGGEWFVDALDLKVDGERKSWHYEGTQSRQVGGFVQAYRQLTFVTIRGSGHMVPQDKPIPALEMITNFLRNKPFN